jgi:hypothetical protein
VYPFRGIDEVGHALNNRFRAARVVIGVFSVRPANAVSATERVILPAIAALLFDTAGSRSDAP